MRKLFAILIFNLCFLFIFPVTLLAANYGDGTYGQGDYGVADVPETVHNSTSNGSGTPSSSECGDSAVRGIADLFEIRTTKDTATLYFAPPPMPYSNFYIAFSRKTDVWEYGTQYNQGYSGGVLRYAAKSLQPNTKYYFRIRAGNGCANGGWSNTVVATTTNGSQTRTYYKSFIRTIVKQAKAMVSNLLPNNKTTNNPMNTAKPIVITVPEANTQTPTQAPTKSKFCILWWCF